jgi:ATP-dependent Clp protease ATP-binding subunit ClpX
MFDLPSIEGVQEVVVNEEAVTSVAQPLLIYSERKKKDEPASAG